MTEPADNPTGPILDPTIAPDTYDDNIIGSILLDVVNVINGNTVTGPSGPAGHTGASTNTGPTGQTGGFVQYTYSGGTGSRIYVGPMGPAGPIQNSIYFPPSVDPQVPGALWNNGGTLTFSPGIPGGG